MMKSSKAAKMLQNIISASNRSIASSNGPTKKIVKIWLIAILVFCHCMTNARSYFNNNLTLNSISTIQPVVLNWTKQAGTSGGQAYGNGVSTDNSGNIYVTGNTNIGLSGQIQNGINDYFIAKYAASGNLIWTRQVGAAGGNTYGNGVSIDNSGNTYITGRTSVGLSGQNQNGSYDYFIAKYGISGNLIWSKQVGAAGGTTQGYGISTDNSGNIFVSGWTNVGLSGQKQNGSYDYFIARYDVNGNLIWSRQVGSSGGDTRGRGGVSVDNSGNIYVTGFTNKGISGQIQNGSYDYFIAKYDVNGNLQWSRQVGSFGGDTRGYGISADNSGNIYVTGKTSVGLSGQTQNGSSDYYIAKYNVNGNLIWSRQVGRSGGTTQGMGVSADNFGDIYVTGWTTVGISGQTQNGINDYFMAKYDATGVLMLTSQVGSSGGQTRGRGISVNNSGSIYIAGYTTVGISGQTQNGVNDYFIAGFIDNGIWAKQVGSSGGFTYGSGVSTDSLGNSYVTGQTSVGLSGQIQNGYYGAVEF